MQEVQIWSPSQKDPLEKRMTAHYSILPGKSHGQRSLLGYSPWDHKRVGHNSASKQQSSVQSLSHVRFFVTPWIAARQGSLYITISRSSLKLTSIESLMPSSHLILGRPLLLLPPILPSIRVFSSELALHTRWPSIGASASVLPVSIQGWFPLGLTGLISLQPKELFSSSANWKHQFFSAQPSSQSNSYIHTWPLGKP